MIKMKTLPQAGNPRQGLDLLRSTITISRRTIPRLALVRKEQIVRL